MPIKYFVNELVSGYSVESLTKVYCCKKYSTSRLCCVRASENTLHHVCEESVCGIVKSEVMFGGEDWDVWSYVL